MGYRRLSRELAMQALFYLDMRRVDSSEDLERFCESFQPPENALPFFRELVDGVLRHKIEIDELIERFSKNWKIYRMSGVDRNVMRIAVYELCYGVDIPHKVAINEAIDIGKKFGTRESGSFINGILDSIHLSRRSSDTDSSERR